MKNQKTNLIEVSKPPEYVDSGRRPSKLTPELLAQFRSLLPNCFFIKTAADLLGVHRQSFYTWRKRGKREADRMAAEETNMCRKSEAMYVEFYYASVEIMAFTEMRSISNIIAAGNAGIWQADVWQLERRYPDRYGSNRREIKEIAKVAVEQGKEIARLQDEVHELIAKLKAALGEDCGEKRRK